MRTVQFFANTPDDTHCVQASFKIMLKYFLPDLDFSWPQMDRLTHKTSGKGTTWFPALVEFEKLGLKTKYIENFDYEEFYKYGKEYIYRVYEPEIADWYLENSNILEVKSDIPEFLKKSMVEKRPATLDDIDESLNSNWLVCIDVNSRILNDAKGFASHAVVVIDKNQNYVIHDPGPPAKSNYLVTANKLKRAWSYAGKKNMALLAIGR